MAIPDNYQNEMMVLAFAATLMATIPILLGNEFDVNVGLKKKKVNEMISTLPAIKKNLQHFIYPASDPFLWVYGDQ